MKISYAILTLAVFAVGCEKTPDPSTAAASAEAKAEAPAAPATAAPRKKDPNEPKDVVDIAVGSKDHTTLVTALQKAEYVDSLTNAGPFTVFAPTNAAFDKLPKGTVESLVTPEKKDDLRNILKYHVTVSVYQQAALKDGMMLGMADGAKATVHVKDGKVMVNEATIVASIPASNGIVHVIDTVLLPPKP